MSSSKLTFVAGVALIFAGPLVPNHYLPWAAFHADAVTIVGFLIVLLTLLVRRGPTQWPRLAAFFLVLSLAPLLQWAFGLIFFFGDAFMASLYLILFSLSIVVGDEMLRQRGREECLFALALGLTVAALLSAGIALYQWLRLSGLGIYAVDLPPLTRPYANLGQPNQLATLLLMGLVATHMLFRSKRIGLAGLVACSAVLVFALAMTQSRTAYVSMLGLVVWVLLMQRRADLRNHRNAVLLTALAFAVITAAWQPLTQALNLDLGRESVMQQAGGERRLIHWASMVDAVERQPVFGYGWNQVSVAQARVAVAHPASHELVEHSHNVLLDLLVWNGIPLGLLVIAVVGWWLWRHIRACRDADAALLLAGIGVVLVHGMFEFPLEYAYFFLPVGLMMGAVESLVPVSPRLGVPYAATAVLVAGLTVMLGWVAAEYVQVEANSRLMRLEAAHIGTHRIESAAPDLVLLTQLSEFLRFARTQATPGMPADRLDWMRKIAERYGYAPVLLRYALAAGLNGRPGEATNTLARLCKLHAAERCSEGRDAWAAMAHGQYPQLESIPFPALSRMEPSALSK